MPMRARAEKFPICNKLEQPSIKTSLLINAVDPSQRRHKGDTKLNYLGSDELPRRRENMQMNLTAAAAISTTSAPVLHYEMISDNDIVGSFEGNKVGVDTQGKIDKLQYADGSSVRRHDGYVIVQSCSAGFWFGDNQGRWFAID
jgi:hypothetical protein